MTDKNNHQIDGIEPKYYARIPNMLIDDLNYKTLALYVYYKRIASDQGKCWQSTATIAKSLGMSASVVRAQRNKLVALNLITVEEHIENGIECGTKTIRLINIWQKNVDTYTDPPIKNSIPPYQKRESPPLKTGVKENLFKEIKDSPAQNSGDEKTKTLPDDYRDLNCLDCEKIISGGDEVHLIAGEGNDYRVRCHSCQEKIGHANTSASDELVIQPLCTMIAGLNEFEVPEIIMVDGIRYILNYHSGGIKPMQLMDSDNELSTLYSINGLGTDSENLMVCFRTGKVIYGREHSKNATPALTVGQMADKALDNYCHVLAIKYGNENKYTKLHKSALAATEVNGYCRSAAHNGEAIADLIEWGLLKKSGQKYITTAKGREERTGFAIGHDAEYLQMIVDLLAYNKKQEVLKAKPKPAKKKKSKKNDLDLSTKPEILELVPVLCLEYFHQQYDQLTDASKLTAIQAGWEWRKLGADTPEKVREVIGHYESEEWSTQLTIFSLTKNGRIPQALGSIVAVRNKPEEREFNIGEMK